MSFKCSIGLHSWDGCKCSDCGKIRDSEHDVAADCGVCTKCGTIFDIDHHDWSADCEKSAKCGKTHENQHQWHKDCEKCSKCGKIRSNVHHLIDDICQVCNHGYFTDHRDGAAYKIIKIGSQVIMAENMSKRPAKGKFW